MGCFPKFNSIALINTFGTSDFLRGILNLNFKQTESWKTVTEKTVEWVSHNIKGRPVYLTDHAELLSDISDVHQLWPSADNPNDFTADLVNTYRTLFDREQSPEDEDLDTLSNGDEYVVILVRRAVDLRLVTRLAKDVRPAVFITWDDTYHGNHNKFMPHWSLNVQPDNSCVVVRDISGPSGITIKP